ncbi:GNAT family N-acetyltransferase [Patulibacter sp. SYSU D01012]|uniref:GNAT family N-acetyltransferase n=1 Tax=Patulibacter sp. SYSU D01012 TaxID=2817381 RepID=UPI001B311C10
MDPGTAPRELRTARLLLRGWRADDAAAFAALNADPEVMRHIATGPLDRRASEDLRARLQHEWERAGHGLWALERRDDGALLGFCGLAVPGFARGLAAGTVEVGWRLRRDAWGHGYATEASRAALRVAWADLGRDHVVSLVHPDNARSLAVCERLGMRVVGRTTHVRTGWPLLVLRADRPRPEAPPRRAAAGDPP